MLACAALPRRGETGVIFHPLAILGWLLLLGSLVAYITAIVAAVLRIERQYSRTLLGGHGMRSAAAFAAAGRLLYLLPVAIIGAALIVLSGR